MNPDLGLVGVRVIGRPTEMKFGRPINRAHTPVSWFPVFEDLLVARSAWRVPCLFRLGGRSRARLIGMQRRSWMMLGLLAGLAPACEPEPQVEDPGRPGDPGRPEDRGHRCEEVAQVYALGQPTPSGMTSDRFAQVVLGEHLVMLGFVRLDASNPGVPEKTQGVMRVELSPGAVFSHVRSTYIPCKDPEGCPEKAVECYDSFSLPVRVMVQATNGAMDEFWVGALTGLDVKDARLGKLDDTRRRLDLSRPAHTFQGAFKLPALLLPEDAELKEHELVLRASWSDTGFEGGNISNLVQYFTGSGLTRSLVLAPGGPGVQISQI